MRLAVTGKQGQVTRALQALAGPDLEILAIGRPELDLADPGSVAEALSKIDADAVISAAAYTAVDKAESDSETAFTVNRDGAGAVAKAAALLGLPVLHLSTDYVYDGAKSTPYQETDETGPTSIYGQSKLAGEVAVAAANPNHAIFRTAWVYSPYGNNFVKTMLRLAETRDSLTVVADQRGCPTSAEEIANALVVAAEKLTADADPRKRGIFHLAGSGETSWADFARFIFKVREDVTGKAIKVTDIATPDYPTPAKRPANSRLDCAKLEEAFGIRLPDWQSSTQSVVETLLEKTGERA